jgi:hypothetical protein
MKPDILLSELWDAVYNGFDIETSTHTITCELRHHGLTYKKVLCHSLTMVLLLTFISSFRNMLLNMTKIAVPTSNNTWEQITRQTSWFLWMRQVLIIRWGPGHMVGLPVGNVRDAVTSLFAV